MNSSLVVQVREHYLKKTAKWWAQNQTPRHRNKNTSDIWVHAMNTTCIYMPHFCMLWTKNNNLILWNHTYKQFLFFSLRNATIKIIGPEHPISFGLELSFTTALTQLTTVTTRNLVRVPNNSTVATNTEWNKKSVVYAITLWTSTTLSGVSEGVRNGSH